MLTNILLRDIETLLKDLGEAEPFLVGLKKLSDSYDSLFQFIAGTAQGGPKINEFASQLHSAASQARAVLDEMPVREFFRSMESAQRSFAALEAEHSLALRIEAFSDMFDQFVRRQNPHHAMPVLREAHLLRLLIDAYVSALRFVSTELASSPLLDGEEPFTLTLHGTYGLTDVLAKMSAMRAVFEAIESLLEDTPHATRFRLLRIETGSVSLSVAAGALAIALLRRFIVAAVQFAYRNYTREGKLRHGVVDEVKALEDLIRLRAKLDKVGLETDEMDRRLERAGTSIAENLAVLVRGENEVQLDDDLYANSPEDQQRQLSYRRTPQLPVTPRPPSNDSGAA